MSTDKKKRNPLAVTLIGPPALTIEPSGSQEPTQDHDPSGPKDNSIVDVHTVVGTEELSELFEYEIEVRMKEGISEGGASADIELPNLLGQTVAVRIPASKHHDENQEATERFLNGIVIAAERLGIRDGKLAFSITMAPALWLATRNRDSRIFQGKTVPEVVEAVLAPYKVNLRQSLYFKKDYRTWDYLTQYRESDYDFIKRILAYEGIYFFFEHTEKIHTMVLADSMSSHAPTKGYATVPLASPLDKNRAPDYLLAWDDRYAIQTTSVRLGDYDFRLQRSTQPGRTQLEAFAKVDPPHAVPVVPKAPHWPLEIYDYPAHLTLSESEPDFRSKNEGAHKPTSDEEGDRLAHVRLDEQQSRLRIFRGEGTARGLATGALFALAHKPKEQFLITSTSLTVRNAATASGGSGQVDEPVTIRVRGISNSVVYRPTYLPKPLVLGPQTARVVGKQGEEIDTDKYGRIRIQMHWDRDGKFNEGSSCWVRVAQPWAGNRWGVVFNPRIGNEVVVEFLEGDPDRPLVTGSVYNIDNMPPYTLSENQSQSGIKTRSTKGGTEQNFNEIRFEDKKGGEELFVQAERDQNTKVKRNQSISVGGSRSVSVGGDQSISVSGNQTVTISGGGKGAVQSTMTVTGHHELTVSKTIKIEATDKITLKVGDTEIVLTPHDITLTAADGAATKMTAEILSTAKDGAQSLLNANVDLQSSGGSAVHLDAKALMGGSQGATVDGGPETLVKGGSGSVKADGGGVTVTGPTIKLNS